MTPITQTKPILVGVTGGQPWELLQVVPNNYSGIPGYRILLDGAETWARDDIRRAIRTELDPEWAAQQRKIARRRTDEAAKVEQSRRENAARLARCERDGKRVHVRYGYARSGFRSTNHRDNRLEDGLSVYAAWLMPDGNVVLDMRGVDVVSYMLGGFTDRQMYMVRSARGPIGTGSDGEPLIGRFNTKRINPTNVELVI